MTRRSLTRLQKVRIFDAAGGICHLCGLKIWAGRGEQWHVEHVTPLSFGGADDESNMKPAHVKCHADKTREEAPIRAKSDRVRAHYLGIKKTTSLPIPGSRASGIRKRMNGTVERWT